MWALEMRLVASVLTTHAGFDEAQGTGAPLYPASSFPLTSGLERRQASKERKLEVREWGQV